jgi:DNA-binding winged helix-turn-helix (wHTH) protein
VVVTTSTPARLLLLVVGPPAEAAGFAELLPHESVDILVCADASEALRALQSVSPTPVRPVGSAPAVGSERPLRAGALRLHPAALEAELHGRRITLPPREFRLLHLLMSHAGHVVTRDEIRKSVWGAGERDASNTITVHIQRLRTRLGDPSHDPAIIQTVRRLGYRLVPPPRRTRVT